MEGITALLHRLMIVKVEDLTINKRIYGMLPYNKRQFAIIENIRLESYDGPASPDPSPKASIQLHECIMISSPTGDADTSNVKDSWSSLKLSILLLHPLSLS